jgi:ribosomal protein S8
MRRYIVLLLITGIVWAQTDFDTLVLKDGTTYFGEYSKIEEEIVYFKPQDAFAFQPISIKKIKILQLKDGQFIIGSSSDILTYEENQKESLEEYQKLSAKEKEIYDAKSRKFKYVVGVIIVTVVFVALVADFSAGPDISLSSGGDYNGHTPW